MGGDTLILLLLFAMWRGGAYRNAPTAARLHQVLVAQSHIRRNCHVDTQQSVHARTSCPKTSGDSGAQTTRRDGLGKPKGYADAMLQYAVQRHILSGLPNLAHPYTVLGIESSCDDTGVGIVRSDGAVLANVVISQYDIHERFGGIVPSLAMEAHKMNIETAVSRALQEAGTTMGDIDAIAVTKGPGLEICLRVGCRKAQQLASDHGKPFVAIHHLEAHCMVARLAGERITSKGTTMGGNVQIVDSTASPAVAIAPCNDDNQLRHFTPKITYPYLALLVSGGHTSLMVVSGLGMSLPLNSASRHNCKIFLKSFLPLFRPTIFEKGNYTLLGGTLDDSVGEAFDKAARYAVRARHT